MFEDSQAEHARADSAAAGAAAVAAAAQGGQIEILHPLADSVVRRQSVEIEIQISGLQVPLEGYGLVQVDGRTIRCLVWCPCYIAAACIWMLTAVCLLQRRTPRAPGYHRRR